jgi:hypothetical protein
LVTTPKEIKDIQEIQDIKEIQEIKVIKEIEDTTKSRSMINDDNSIREVDSRTWGDPERSNTETSEKIKLSIFVFN